VCANASLVSVTARRTTLILLNSELLAHPVYDSKSSMARRWTRHGLAMLTFGKLFEHLVLGSDLLYNLYINIIM